MYNKFNNKINNNTTPPTTVAWTTTVTWEKEEREGISTVGVMIVMACMYASAVMMEWVMVVITYTVYVYTWTIHTDTYCDNRGGSSTSAWW